MLYYDATEAEWQDYESDMESFRFLPEINDDDIDRMKEQQEMELKLVEDRFQYQVYHLWAYSPHPQVQRGSIHWMNSGVHAEITVHKNGVITAEIVTPEGRRETKTYEAATINFVCKDLLKELASETFLYGVRYNAHHRGYEFEYERKENGYFPTGK